MFPSTRAAPDAQNASWRNVRHPQTKHLDGKPSQGPAAGHGTTPHAPGTAHGAGGRDVTGAPVHLGPARGEGEPAQAAKRSTPARSLWQARPAPHEHRGTSERHSGEHDARQKASWARHSARMLGTNACLGFTAGASTQAPSVARTNPRGVRVLGAEGSSKRTDGEGPARRTARDRLGGRRGIGSVDGKGSARRTASGQPSTVPTRSYLGAEVDTIP
ncbi:hypothetical protein RJ55_05657 [Drechmeria coniospora]|nr:hypothetical protein RJ55_05657 [Drechmeria coniospora]